MKLAIASDLHLEFAPIVLNNDQGAEVLLLAGDICVAHDLLEHDSANFTYGHAGHMSAKSKRIHDFFYDCCNKFPHVIYVVGNHEHYHGDFKYTVKELKRLLKYLPNLIILDTESHTLFDDVTFIGGTLWTDMNKEDALTLFHMKDRMSDYRYTVNSNRMTIRNVPIYEKNPLYTDDGRNGGQYKLDESGYHIKIGMKSKEEPARLAPEDTVAYHRKMVEYIKIVTDGKLDKKFVVVGHHAPSKASTHPRYKHDVLMNGAYSTDLSEFILDRPCIKLWVHGHTHDPFDYMIGSTRIVCNPRGYSGWEDRAEHFELKYIDV